SWHLKRFRFPIKLLAQFLFRILKMENMLTDLLIEKAWKGTGLIALSCRAFERPGCIRLIGARIFHACFLEPPDIGIRHPIVHITTRRGVFAFFSAVLDLLYAADFRRRLFLLNLL